MIASMIFRRASTVALIAVVVPVLATSLSASPRQPGWSNKIIVTGHERDVVKSTPIEMRPYRPLHVYGNTVRRRYYHSGLFMQRPQMPVQRFGTPSVFGTSSIR